MPELLKRQFLSQENRDRIDISQADLMTQIIGGMLKDYQKAHGHWDMLNITISDSLDSELELPPGLIIFLSGWKNEEE